jgi:hypothetical protein
LLSMRHVLEERLPWEIRLLEWRNVIPYDGMGVIEWRKVKVTSTQRN